jgi:thiamine-phosphate pyrophosphorylase
LPPARYKKIFGQHLLVGVSCHSIGEVLAAEQDGADYAFLSPIFAPLSKPSASPPLGLEALNAAARQAKIPIIALGGVTPQNEKFCLDSGAQGIAGISYFLLSPSPRR